MKDKPRKQFINYNPERPDGVAKLLGYVGSRIAEHYIQKGVDVDPLLRALDEAQERTLSQQKSDSYLVIGILATNIRNRYKRG